jgi:hypothetical protein
MLAKWASVENWYPTLDPTILLRTVTVPVRTPGAY